MRVKPFYYLIIPFKSSYFWLSVCLLYLNITAFGQVFCQSIKNDKVPKELIREALQAHNELIKGTIGSALNNFKSDSLMADWNEGRISTLHASEEFKHRSARIDTQYSMVVEPNNLVMHHIAFRDIHYMGNNKFKRFRISFSYRCTRGKDFKIIQRELSYGIREIPSQKEWGGWVWR